MYIITTTRQQQEVARWQVSIMRNIQSHENQWVSDIVGGDTPEETLRMYVNALEEKNFELASQYWYTERRSDILEQLNSKVGRISVREVRESFIQNYRDGVYEGKIINSKTDDTVEMYRATFSERESGKFLMAVTLIKNPFTEKWKMYL